MEILSYVPKVSAEWINLLDDERLSLNDLLVKRDHKDRTAENFLALNGAEEEITLRSLLSVFSLFYLSNQGVLPMISRTEQFVGGYRETKYGVISILTILTSPALTRSGYQNGILFAKHIDSNEFQYKTGLRMVVDTLNGELSNIGRAPLPTVS